MSALVDAEGVRQAADKLKDEGNQFLLAFKYNKAIDKYTEAIALNESAIYYSNRAQAYIKEELYGSAIEDANKAIELDPRYVKAYYRRGSANFALGKLKAAQKDFKSVLVIVPNDQDAQKKLAICQKAIKAEAFAAAIESDVETCNNVSMDFSTIVVEDKYAGPRIGDDGVITPDFMKSLLEWFKDRKSLHRRYVVQILFMISEHYSSVSSLLKVNLPLEDPNRDKSNALTRPHIKVCGDTHGQFYDLCNIFQIGGFPSEYNPYMFNGDYVDRGSFSVETVLTLFAFRLMSPRCMYLLRGNHETKNMNKLYGFEGEVLHKFDQKVMLMFTKAFNNLPLAAVIESKVFVVHGGIGVNKDGEYLISDIESIRRDREPPESGLFSELLWSDPHPGVGKKQSNRGVGFSFGRDITEKFLRTNNLKLVVRSHEVKDEGYEVDHGGKCITIFSAPNYCDQMGNKGAFIRFFEDLEANFVQFTAVPHPQVPPMAYSSGYMSQFGL